MCCVRKCSCWKVTPREIYKTFVNHWFKTTITLWHSVSQKFSPKTSLNDYLREVAGLKGTKVMCREAGCGCCSVTVSHTRPDSDKLETYSVQSVSGAMILLFSASIHQMLTFNSNVYLSLISSCHLAALFLSGLQTLSGGVVMRPGPTPSLHAPIVVFQY